MMRRCLSLLLVVAYAVLQVAAVPHAHETVAASSHGRGERHIHHGRPAHHEHLQHEASSHHKHAAAVHSHDHAPPPQSPSEHDSDAVYVPDVMLARVDLLDTYDWSACGSLFEIAFCTSVVDLAIDIDTRFEMLDRADGYSVGHCALFLKLRTLRI